MRSTRFRLHVGIEGETGRGDGRGRKGWREEECWVGSDAFLLVRFPSLPFEATLHRRARQSLHISYVHSIIVLPPYTVLSATTLLFADRSRRGLIIKYFLDNRIAAPRLSSGPRKWPCMLTFV